MDEKETYLHSGCRLVLSFGILHYLCLRSLIILNRVIQRELPGSSEPKQNEHPEDDGIASTKD